MDRLPDAPASWTAREGSPSPLGVSFVEAEAAFNFALYSEHAERVTLLLYGEENAAEPIASIHFDPRANKTGRVWHCRLAAEEIEAARYYAYAVGGPATDGIGDRRAFDEEKVLFDPYAQALFFPDAFDRSAAAKPGSNAGRAPLGLIRPIHRTFSWKGDRRPRHESDAILYELHVRNFTMSPTSGVDHGRRGTFAGVIDKIPYLRALGVTIVELMPIFQCDPSDPQRWGYMPIAFFAPHDRYAAGRTSCDQHCEFREMVKALHRADIEVVLDVVYNHTGEGDHRGPTYSFRGIDDRSYYLMSGNSEKPYADFAGTGNILNCSNRYVRKMILDSMRFWVREMHVDGFRFDLASVFGRRADGSIDWHDPPIIGDVASDPDLAGVRLIAEPWDASGAYQLGKNFPGRSWLQWNDRFRDDLRRFVRGDPGMVGAVMQRLYGSDDLFPDTVLDACRPYQSLNYVASHDGFTLYDLLAYDRKHNEANGHDNTDGPNEVSFSSGHEGDVGAPPELRAMRERHAKNLVALLFLSNGTPMLRAGDELLHTQRGNSNPYNQDGEIVWLDWSRADAFAGFHRFVREMIAFRKRHPTLVRSRFWRSDVEWYGVRGGVDLGASSRAFAFHLDGRAEADVDLNVMINAGAEDREFTIQRPGRWRRAIDTSQPSPEDIFAPGEEQAVRGDAYLVRARSVVVLLR